MQSVSNNFIAQSGANSQLHYLAFGVLIAWLKQNNASYSLFTIGESSIGGPDFIPSQDVGLPSYWNQYQYTDYSSYAMSTSVTRNLGQYPYGVFGAQGSAILENTELLFYPGYDPTIGNYITYGRPLSLSYGFKNPNTGYSETISLFYGTTNQPINDIAQRQITLTAFDGVDFINGLTSYAKGPLASALNGAYYQGQNYVGTASNGVSLPQSTIYLTEQPNGFLPTGGTATILSTTGYQSVSYLGVENTGSVFALTGCTGGTGIIYGPGSNSSTGYSVSSQPIYAQTIIQDLLLEAGVAESQFVLEQSSQGPIGYYSPYGLLMGNIIQAICEAEQGLFFQDENGIYRFWNRQHIAENQQSVWTFDEKTSLFDFQPEETPVINDVTVTASPRAVQADQQIYVASSASQIPAPTITTVLTNLCTNPSFETSVANWTLNSGGTFTQITTDYYVGSACAYFSSLGGSTHYVYTAIACNVSTEYASQCYVKAATGAIITAAIIENGVTLTSASVTTTGSWQLLETPSFVTDGTHTTFNFAIYTSAASAIKIDAVMVQLSAGASSTYFDGNTTFSSSYIYSWSGTTNLSTSTATPCGSYTIEVDFQDTQGSLPVTSVDIPIYYTNSSATSTYQANTADDNSGTDMQSYVSIAGISLVNQPDDAANLTGSSYFITFTNTFTSPVYVTNLTLWGTPAKVTYTINQQYQNQASIALYGDNPANNGITLTIDNDLIQSPDTALSNATILVNDYSVPYQRAVADVTAVPQLQIGDTVTVAIDDLAETQATPIGVFLPFVTQSISLPQYTEYTVVGITINSSEQNYLQQQLELEVKVLAQYFTIGVSAIGSVVDAIAPG